MFLSRSTERQAGNDGKTVVIDWFSKTNELTNMCIYFREISISCIFRVYLFSRMTFKRKFRVYFNFAKSTKIREIRENMYTRKLVRLR